MTPFRLALAALLATAAVAPAQQVLGGVEEPTEGIGGSIDKKTLEWLRTKKGGGFDAKGPAAAQEHYDQQTRQMRADRDAWHAAFDKYVPPAVAGLVVVAVVAAGLRLLARNRAATTAESLAASDPWVRRQLEQGQPLPPADGG